LCLVGLRVVFVIGLRVVFEVVFVIRTHGGLELWRLAGVLGVLEVWGICGGLIVWRSVCLVVCGCRFYVVVWRSGGLVAMETFTTDDS